MSLINKMLRDLDSRHAVGAQASLPVEVRSLPGQERRLGNSRLIWLLAAPAAAAALLAAAYWLRWLPAAPKNPAIRQLAQESVLPLPTLSDTIPVPEAPPPPRVGAAASAKASGLKIDSTLSPAAAPVETPTPAAPARARVLIDKAPPAGGQAESDYRKGVAAFQQGRMAAAAAQFRAALQRDPRHLAARQTLLAMLAGQKQWDDAEVLLRQGLQLMPAQSAWAMALARIEVERGDPAAAWATLAQHLDSARNNADYLGFAGVLLARLHQPHDAAAYYQSALRLRPREGRWWLGLGLTLAADGRAAEAQEAFRHARDADGLTPEMATFLDKRLR